MAAEVAAIRLGKGSMSVEDNFRNLRKQAKKLKIPPVPDAYQGVTLARIGEVLSAIDLNKPDIIAAVFALLDDQLPSQFPKAKKAGFRFCDGATTAHIGAHVGILQRGSLLKLDREGRDYWIKPLAGIGAIEPVIFVGKSAEFLDGHPVAKSPNSAYRLNAEFLGILKDTSSNWETSFRQWVSEDARRERLAFQANAAALAESKVDRKHHALIQACVKHYAPHFLRDYVVLYIDDSDGERVSDAERSVLDSAGIEIRLGDAMPDVLLWNPKARAVWIIEAVTSDGEVDDYKVEQVNAAMARSGIKEVGFTTAYPNWRLAAQRQAQHKNIASGTYVWIADDPTKQFYADSFTPEDK